MRSEFSSGLEELYFEYPVARMSLTLLDTCFSNALRFVVLYVVTLLIPLLEGQPLIIQNLEQLACLNVSRNFRNNLLSKFEYLLIH